MAKKKTKPGEPDADVATQDDGFGDLENLFFAQDAGTFVRDEPAPTTSAAPPPPPPPVQARGRPTEPAAKVPPPPPPPAQPASEPSPKAAPPPPFPESPKATGSQAPKAVGLGKATPAPPKSSVRFPPPPPPPPTAVPEDASWEPTRDFDDEPPIRDISVPPAIDDIPAPAQRERAGAGPSSLDDADVRAFFSTGELPRHASASSRASEPRGRPAPPPRPASRTDLPPAPVEDLAPPPAEGAGGWSSVLDELRQALDGVKDASRRAETLQEMARIRGQKLGDWKGAADLCRKALDASPEQAPALRELVRLAAAGEKWSDAVSWLERQARAANNPAGTAAALLAAAQIRLAQLDDVAGAEADLSGALAAVPSSYIALRFLREIHYRLEQWDELVAVLDRTRAAVAPPHALRLSYELGRVYDEVLRRPSDACACFVECLEADPLFLPALLAVERLAPSQARLGDLPRLYVAFAEAAGGADAGQAFLKAARIADREVGDVEAAIQAYRRASDGPDREVALEEWTALLLRTGREGEALALLRERIGSEADPGARSRLLERLGEAGLYGGDVKAATEAFTEAVNLAPQAPVAREGLRIALVRAGAWADLAAFYQERADASSDLRVRTACRMKAAEVLSERLDDSDAALAAWRRAADESQGFVPALEGLVWALSAAGRHAEAAEVARKVSERVEDPETRSAWLTWAGQTFLWRGDDPASGAACLSAASATAPSAALTAWQIAGAQSRLGRWNDAAEALNAAAARVPDPQGRASLLYAAARIALVHADREGAEACLKAVLDASPGFLAASLDYQEIQVAARGWETLAALAEREASATEDPATRVGLLLAAARHAERAHRPDRAIEHLKAVREIDPSQADALTGLWRLLGRSGQPQLLDALLKGAAGAARDRATTLRLQLLDSLRLSGQAGAVASATTQLLADPVGRPLPALSMGAACEGLGQWEAAMEAYAVAASGSDTLAARASARYQHGLLNEEFREDADAAAVDYDAALERVPGHSMALDGLERVNTARRDRQGLARVYGLQAAGGGPDPVSSFYALLAGDFHVELGQDPEAAGFYRIAFADTVGRERAFEALRRLMVRGRDAAGVAAITEEFAAALPPTDAAARRMEGAELLLQAGDEAGAVRLYEAVRDADPGHLASAWHLMDVYPRLERWNSLLGVLEAAADAVKSPRVNEALRNRRDAVLAQHDVDQPEYLPFFEKLHAADGRNALALKGLASIALRQGRHDDAELYLTELAEVADTEETRAAAAFLMGRLQLEHRHDDTRAAEAFERALNHDPRNAKAMQALKEIHRRTENWKALVGVLSREAASAPEALRVSLYSEIATIWEDQLSNPRVAAASWQKVVQQQPSNDAAHRHLLEIHRREQDWPAWVEVGAARVEHLPDAERPAFLHELGRVAETELKDLDSAVAFYERAAAGPEPVPGALGALRRLARLRGDWDRVVDLAGREAAVTTAQNGRVALLVERARIRLDHLLDREGAADDFRAALDLDPRQQDALEFFLDYDFDGERWTAARQVFEAFEERVAAKDLDDDDVREEVTAYYYKFGRVLAALGDEVEAIRRFEQALELTPAHLPSLEEVAPRQFARKAWPPAAEAYKAILRLKGGTGDAEQVLHLNLQLGLAELEMGKVDSAQKRFRKVLEINPNHVGGLKGITRIYYLREDWNSLLSTYNAIIKYARDADEVIAAYMTKGDVLDEKLGFADKAVLHYEKVLSYDKANARAMRRLAEIAWKREEDQPAASWADRATSASRQPGDRIQSLLLAAVVRGGGAAASDLLDQADRIARDSGLHEGAVRALRQADVDRDSLFEAYRQHFPLGGIL